VAAWRLARILAVLVLLVGCSAAPPSAAPTAAAQADGTHVAILTATQPTTACELAQLEGLLVVDARSGLAVRADSGQVTPVRWPFGYVAIWLGGTPVLLDATASPIAATGDRVSMAGGIGNGGTFNACGAVQRVKEP